MIDEVSERNTDLSLQSKKESLDLSLGLPTSYMSDLENQTSEI